MDVDHRTGTWVVSTSPPGALHQRECIVPQWTTMLHRIPRDVSSENRVAHMSGSPGSWSSTADLPAETEPQSAGENERWMSQTAARSTASRDGPPWHRYSALGASQRIMQSNERPHCGKIGQLVRLSRTKRSRGKHASGVRIPSFIELSFCFPRAWAPTLHR